MALSKKYKSVLKALRRGKDRDAIARTHQVGRDQVDDIAREHGVDGSQGTQNEEVE